MSIVHLGPGDPGIPIGADHQVEEAGAEGRVERRHLVFVALPVDGRAREPILRQLVLVQPPDGEQLEGRLLDVSLGPVQLLEEEDPGTVGGERARPRVSRPAVLDHRQAHQVRRLQ